MLTKKNFLDMKKSFRNGTRSCDCADGACFHRGLNFDMQKVAADKMTRGAFSEMP